MQKWSIINGVIIHIKYLIKKEEAFIEGIENGIYHFEESTQETQNGLQFVIVILISQKT
jgi:hypothetical protein